jgi:hypothetical protein
MSLDPTNGWGYINRHHSSTDLRYDTVLQQDQTYRICGTKKPIFFFFTFLLTGPGFKGDKLPGGWLLATHRSAQLHMGSCKAQRSYSELG